jgi:dihydrodipicolinate synthase/N-acetylneuraminate lyase
MSGQTGPVPDRDEAARLEQALARIAKALARPPSPTPARPCASPLHEPASHVTTPRGAPDAADIAARLDSLILELRTLLGEQDV